MAAGNNYIQSWYWRYIISATCLLLSINCFAQDNNTDRHFPPGFGIEANLITGKVFKHEAKFTLPIPDISTGADINLVWHTYGHKPWEQRTHYPRIGLAATYINYGIDSIYGRCIGIYPNIIFPLLTGKKLEWVLRIGDGVGYVTKTYSRVNPVDTINVAIGSSINDLIMIVTDAHYHINPHWNVQAGANITHISNGSVRKPNLGVNMAGVHIGVSYFPVTSHPQRITRELKPLSNRYLFQLRAGASLVSSYTPGGPLYPVYLTTAYISHRWKDMNKVFVGIDYSYHDNVYAFLRNNELERGSEKQHAWKSAILAGNEFMIGRVSIAVQAGVYIRQAYIYNADIYEKVTASYYMVQHEHGPIKELFIYTSLKAHLSVAELGEMGLGIGI